MISRRARVLRYVAVALLPTLLLLAALAGTGTIDVGPALLVALCVLGGGAVLLISRPYAAAPERTIPPPSAAVSPSALLEPLPDPVLVLDQRRIVVAANRAARDLLGIGGPGRDLAQSLRHPAVLAAVETLASGVPALADEVDLPVPVPRTFTLQAARLSDSDGPGVPAFVLSLHDETRAKRAEQSHADFVANASHELRSPLSALIGFIETLRGPARSDPEARERFLETMRTEALRMARLIEDLLSLSRVEINEHVPPRTTVHLGEVLECVADALSVRAVDKRMEIVLDIAESLPPVTGDIDQLNQVFHNLVDNAIKYGRSGTPIRITAQRIETCPGTDGPGVAVAVADHGDGIASVHLPRITERFYRVDQGRSRKLGGTGLGLAIVKHIVIRHRGQLKVESREGTGSVFTVQVPAADPEDHAVTSEPVPDDAVIKL